uniref:Uncharacterized protein n=1 Tax=Phage sp. cty4N14 TaxID=2825799 RepID=A0A8S5U4W2_9VIRU|nr:MAG TPA: hypothetical protein [Phage sp. cty4N14]
MKADVRRPFDTIVRYDKRGERPTERPAMTVF